MLAVLLLFALVNGLMMYSMISKADTENVYEFEKVMQQGEIRSIDSWLSMANSIIYPYLAMSHKYPDSTENYKGMVLELLKEMHWNESKKNTVFYVIFDAKTGSPILFRDSLGYLLPPDKNVFEISDGNGKFFAKEILNKALVGDTSMTSFYYSKQCMDCPSVGRIAKGIYVQDWNWIIATGSYLDRLEEVSKLFLEKYHDNRIKLVGNLFGIMLVSFLVGLFMVFRQMDSFIIPLRSLSGHLHRLANEGIRFEDFDISSSSQTELKNFAEDINAMVHNVGTLVEDVRISADKVSDLSGSCKDMLNIVEFDVRMGGQRNIEMAVSSEEVVENVKGMAEGIEEIDINLDGLKKLTANVTENTIDIRTSISQMSESMRELNEKASNVRQNTLSVTQAVNDIELASTKELDIVYSINEFAVNLLTELGKMSTQTSALRKAATQGINFINETVDKLPKEKKDPLEPLKNMCETTDKLYNSMMSIQTQLVNLQDSQIVPIMQVLEERKNLSREIHSDTVALDSSISSVVNRIAEINSSTQYINTNVKNVSNNMDEGYRNLEEIVDATNNMNEHAKRATNRMDEFSLKIKKVKDAHFAIENTLKDVRDSMNSLNELSSKLRKVVDKLVRLDNKYQI
jgi:methyl-accepting chemotaxis protein